MFDNLEARSKKQEARSKKQEARSKKQEYWLIDYVKLIGAILVVAIHTDLVNSINNEYYKSILVFFESLAVPFFFTITGYFLQENLKTAINRSLVIQYNLIKYLKMYIHLSLVYIPLTIYGIYYVESGSTAKIFLKIFRNYLLVGEQFYSWPLWYILATIFALVFLLFSNFRKSTSLLMCSSLIFLGSYIINNFDYLKVVRVILVNARIFTGISYMMLGMILYEKQKYFTNIKYTIIPILGLLISTVFKMTYTDTNIVAFISIMWLVGYLTSFVVNNNIGSKLSKLCRGISTYVFYSHMYFLFIWVYILKNINKGINCFLFVISLSICFSILILNLQKYTEHKDKNQI